MRGEPVFGAGYELEEGFGAGCAGQAGAAFAGLHPEHGVA